MEPLFLLGCVNCDEALKAAILEDRFLYRLLTIPVPLIAGGLVVWLAVHGSLARLEKGLARKLHPVAGAGTLIGLGVGGFVDGIVLHQILQVHQMISNEVPPVTLINKGVNMFWDGMFHVSTLLLTMLGIWLTWRLACRRDVMFSGVAFVLAGLLGWGAFNILDSVANHFVFRYHNVVDASASPWAWNIGFFVFGITQAAVGWVGIRRVQRAPQTGVSSRHDAAFG